MNIYIKNDKAIIKVIALRVSSKPSPEMTKVLNDVKVWAENLGFGFLELDKDDYANQFRNNLTQDAQTVCDYLDADPSLRKDTRKLEKMGVKYLE